MTDTTEGQPALPNTPPRRLRRPWYAPWLQVEVIDSNVSDMRQGKSMIASAARVVTEKIKGGIARRTESWMGEAWTMFDLVGELHFLSTTLARRAARARFYVGKVEGSDVVELVDPAKLPEGEKPETVTTPATAKIEKKVRNLFASLGDGFIGLQDIVERAYLNQFVVGASYLVGGSAQVWKPVSGVTPPPVGETDISKLIWKTLSVTEFIKIEGGYELRQMGSTVDSDKTVIKIKGNSVYVISLWNPHPADASVPDSPVRAALPILRELVGLTQHISAQIDSRLAGAGMLVMRSSHSRALKRALSIPEDDPRDPFTEMLIDAMVTPIENRDSASAVVPYVTTIPDGSEKPEYISFSAPLDQFAEGLRDSSIRRIALSLDAPPELLLGQGDSSHWTAWLTQEEVVESHIAPTLAIIARGLTTIFLRPILRGNGLSEAQAEQYAIWFDTSALTVNANAGQDAKDLYALDAISDETLRRANGFDESDAPKKADVKDEAIDMIKVMLEANPGLMNRPGLDVMLQQVTSFLEGNPLPALAAAQAPAGTGSNATGGAPAAPAIPNGRGGPVAPQVNISTPGLPQTRPGQPLAVDADDTGTAEFSTVEELMHA